MSKKIRIVAAQLNLLVGDIAGNLNKHIAAAKNAREQFSADIIVFPELSLTGYPPDDLLLRQDFIEEANHALHTLQATVKDIYCLVGHPHATSTGIYNACSMIYNGTIVGRYAKQHLPNYGVFDEARYFVPGNGPCVIPVHNMPVGLVICEDLWQPGPIQQAATQGARLILSPNASPFESDKYEQRVAILTRRAKEQHVPIVYVNCVGGQDDLVFDGGSMACNAEGEIAQFSGFFIEMLYPMHIDISSTQALVEKTASVIPSVEERIYQALVLGTRDYIEKNHFPGVLLGLSGGIDSALALTIAVDALGKEKVHAVMLPTRFTSAMSLEDAATLAQHVGVRYDSIAIDSLYQDFLGKIAPILPSAPSAITDQNIQARCRAVILMALSNQTGKCVLTTGNHSELAVGYCTLYGDMAGGFDILKDVPKTLVYRLAKYRNRSQTIIPQRIIDRPPTAELAAEQTDQDTLPPYEQLDAILAAYITREESIDAIVQQGFARETVIKIVSWIQKNEYKRRQAPVGPRINHKAFGRDRRYPITSGFKG